MPNISAVRSSLSAIARFGLAAVALSSTMSSAVPTQAAVLQLGPLTFSEVSGDFVLTGGSATQTGFVLQQDVYGPNINLFIAIDGLRSACPYIGGCWFPVQSIVRNLTRTPWLFFDHELQEIYGVASPHRDGLSFAQQINELRPFTSSRFALVDEVIDVRDFVNYSGGTVAPGESVIFNYWISDTTPIDRFYLLQRPNFQVGGIGFVNPSPTPATSTPIPTPVVQRPNSTVSTHPSNHSSTGSSSNSAAVPEPSSLLGILLFGAVAGGMRLKNFR